MWIINFKLVILISIDDKFNVKCNSGMKSFAYHIIFDFLYQTSINTISKNLMPQK